MPILGVGGGYGDGWVTWLGVVWVVLRGAVLTVLATTVDG